MTVQISTRSRAWEGRSTGFTVPDSFCSRLRLASGVSEAGVGEGVGDVGEEVDGDVGEADGEDAALDEGVVAVGDGGEGEAADAGPAEDGLGDDGAGEQAAELQAEDGEDGDERVAEGVAVDDACARRGPWRGRCGCSPGRALRAWRCGPCG